MMRGRPFTTTDVDAEELFGAQASRSPICERGTVGWAGDDEVADLGSDANGNATYIKVTLASGAASGKPVADDGGANGHQILCRVSMPLYFIPPKGTPCYVLFPEGLSESPGTGLILPIAGPHPLRLPNAKEGDVILYSPVTGGFFRLRPDGLLAMCTTDNAATDGNTIALMLSPVDGKEYVSPWGTDRAGPRGVHVETSSGARLDLNAIGGIPGLDTVGSVAKLSADSASLKGHVVTSVGADCGAANAASVLALTTLMTALGVVIAAAVDPTGIPTAAKTAFATALATALPLLQDLGKTT